MPQSVGDQTMHEVLFSLMRTKFTTLTNLYWHLRACRPWQSAMRRRCYRRIQQEKRNLLASGVPPIEVPKFSAGATFKQEVAAQAKKK